ncbi:MAG: FHA domain-containing protein [Acidimicrobiales bacterium]
MAQVTGVSPGSAAPAEPEASTTPVGATCANCQSPTAVGDHFCEVCGRDLLTGEAPDAPVPEPMPGGPDAPEGEVEPPARLRWLLAVDADRDHYERMRPAGIEFPVACPQRVFMLTKEVVLVGRHGDEHGGRPDVDLAGAPEDLAVSRRQALLERNPDGSFAVTDPGSTNGILLADGCELVPPGQRVNLKSGDRLYVGAWTRIEVRAV